MKAIIRYSLCFILLMSTSSIFAQYAANGVKGGLTVGTQRWNNTEREPLFAYHFGYVYESYTTSGKFSYLIDLGYHIKGSAVRSSFFDQAGNLNQITTRNKFGNVSLIAGAKSKLDANFSGGDLYYMVGARAEYTAWDSIQTIANLSRFINRFNYGVTVGGGVEFKLADKVQVFFEVQISPDFSQQFYIPPGRYIANYSGNTVFIDFQEQRVVNTTVEISAGIKFLRY